MYPVGFSRHQDAAFELAQVCALSVEKLIETTVPIKGRVTNTRLDGAADRLPQTRRQLNSIT